MPRRYRPEKRKVAPDPKYSSVLLGAFINKVMQKGKKSTARRAVYTAFDTIQERTNRDPLEVFELAVRNVSPMIEVKPRRVGGATYQVPVEVDPHRRRSLGIRWLLDAARSRPGKGFSDRLAAELMDAAQNTGSAVRKREDTHRMAEANKAFAHYRW
jgi:small subunit ribosomal protein S7